MFLVKESANAKVGNVSATYAPIEQTCPQSCPLLRANACYAKGGNVGLHVKRLQLAFEGLNGDTLAILEAAEIRDAGPGMGGRALRLHVSGDATTEFRARALSSACESWDGPVWTYTHAWRNVPRAAWGEVSVLASCESPEDASRALDAGYAPAVVTGPHPKDGRAYLASNGVKLIPCPAQSRTDVTCDKCRLCWNAPKLLAQRAAIAFEAHGFAKKHVLNVIQ